MQGLTLTETAVGAIAISGAWLVQSSDLWVKIIGSFLEFGILLLVFKKAGFRLKPNDSPHIKKRSKHSRRRKNK